MLYLLFNEGYSARPAPTSSGESLCAEAIRLGRALAQLMPDEPEAVGLLALMLLQRLPAARPGRRRGDLVTLEEQDRARWDRGEIEEARRRSSSAACAGGRPGPYQLQAAIAACHADRADAAQPPTGPRSPRLYGQLATVMPSPVVELNRAVAVAMADGPAAGLALVEALAARGALGATTCCTPPAPICSAGWAAGPRRPELPAGGGADCVRCRAPVLRSAAGRGEGPRGEGPRAGVRPFPTTWNRPERCPADACVPGDRARRWGALRDGPAVARRSTLPVMPETTKGPPPDVAASPRAGPGDALAAMLDLSSPQEAYRRMIDAGGFLEPADGIALSFDRATTDHVLRHHELFSSRIEMKLGNVRPLIPLNVDPPQHSKYRKLLDPLFAPKRMDEQEHDITRRVNGIIDQFIENGSATSRRTLPRSFPARCSWA